MVINGGDMGRKFQVFFAKILTFNCPLTSSNEIVILNGKYERESIYTHI